MKAVGVKDLKAHLSEYLRAVKGGETVLITDRNNVVAELRPPSHRHAAPDSLEDVLDRLAESGEITRAPIAKGKWSWKPKGLGLPAGTAQEILDELRAERENI